MIFVITTISVVAIAFSSKKISICSKFDERSADIKILSFILSFTSDIFSISLIEHILIWGRPSNRHEAYNIDHGIKERTNMKENNNEI